MRARLILETEKWEKIAVEASVPATPADPAHAGMPGMSMPAYGASNTWTFIAGYSAAKLGDFASARLPWKWSFDSTRRNSKRAPIPTAPSPSPSWKNRSAALTRYARGQKDEALSLAKEAMEIELTLAAPSGPPDPIKPAPEFYGEMLLDAGRNAEAVAALELSLQRTPNRTASVKALARARATGTAMR